MKLILFFAASLFLLLLTASQPALAMQPVEREPHPLEAAKHAHAAAVAPPNGVAEPLPIWPKESPFLPKDPKAVVVWGDEHHDGVDKQDPYCIWKGGHKACV